MNPSWKEISGIFKKNNNLYLKPQSSETSLPFLILEGPKTHSIGQKNYSIFREFKSSFRGISLNLANEAPKGTLFCRFLISHLKGGTSGGMSILDKKIDVQENQKQIHVILQEQFSSTNENPVKVDAHLFFEDYSKINKSIDLKEPPKIIV